jgi:hypothetical protein
MEFMQALNNKVRKSWKQMRTLAVVAPFAAASSSGGATTMILLTAAVASFIKVWPCFCHYMLGLGSLVAAAF